MLHRSFVLLCVAIVGCDRGIGEFGVQAGGKKPNPTVPNGDGAQPKPEAPAVPPTKGNTLHLKVVNVYDKTGFGQPVLAFRFLAPKEWKVSGTVKWNIAPNPDGDMIDVSMRAESPDGKYTLESFPIYKADWADDRQYIQMARRFNQLQQNFQPPMNAKQFVQNIVIPTHRRGARIVKAVADAETKKAIADEFKKKLAQTAKMFGVKVRSDAARVQLAHRDSDEWVFAATHILITQGLSPSAAARGLTQKMNMYQMICDRIYAWRAPRGELEKSGGLLKTMLNSFQINPAWESAVQRVRNNVARINLEGVIARGRIWRQTMNEIADMRHKSWLETQKSNDRVFHKMSQSIRGVGDYTSSTSNTKLELPYGYSVAWSNGNDVILSTDPGFNANQHFNGDWTRHDPVH